MNVKRIKTIGIKIAAYDILKKMSEKRKGTTKPDGICSLASEAIEIAFGAESKEMEPISVRPQ